MTPTTPSTPYSSWSADTPLPPFPPHPSFASAHSSTAALIQADVFCSASKCDHAANYLFRFRCLATLWLSLWCILLPVCEYTNSCGSALSIDRSDSVGERGTLAGEGAPAIDADAVPLSARERTLFLLATLGYLSHSLLCLYFLLLLLLSSTHRLLLAQCHSYTYTSLAVLSTTSSSAYPLTLTMKFVALLFQLVIPSVIATAGIYWSLILPFRQPLVWLPTIVLHIGVPIIAVIELCMSRFLFRPKALLHWLLLCLLYLLLAAIVYIRSDRWLYSALSWSDSSRAAIAWTCGPLFVGPCCFLLCAFVQYIRDGRTRGMCTHASDIGSAAARQRAREARIAMRTPLLTYTSSADVGRGEILYPTVATASVADGHPTSQQPPQPPLPIPATFSHLSSSSSSSSASATRLSPIAQSPAESYHSPPLHLPAAGFRPASLSTQHTPYRPTVTEGNVNSSIYVPIPSTLHTPSHTNGYQPSHVHSHSTADHSKPDASIAVPKRGILASTASLLRDWWESQP